METSILTTKLFIPPTPPELVGWPRLLDKIQAALNYKFTLVSALAGFGLLAATILSSVVFAIRRKWEMAKGTGTAN